MLTKLFCKIMSFLRNLLCNWTSRQTKLLIMINKEASTKVVKFMAPESVVVAPGVLVLGPDYSDYVVNMHCRYQKVKYLQVEISLEKWHIRQQMHIKHIAYGG